MERDGWRPWAGVGPEPCAFAPKVRLALRGPRGLHAVESSAARASPCEHPGRRTPQPVNTSGLSERALDVRPARAAEDARGPRGRAHRLALRDEHRSRPPPARCASAADGPGSSVSSSDAPGLPAGQPTFQNVLGHARAEPTFIRGLQFRF